ncbi:hypothetical protein NGK36_21525 [Hafnia alvei]|uniref:hypothetical protein n=1 Tax=Hafnia alvei TaxID=569 RepID=UPI002DBF6D78|nr:hypothetical protein [Hafnia alvei]MEB7891843.1 hypothetical protein [Hafnia alvei]
MAKAINGSIDATIASLISGIHNLRREADESAVLRMASMSQRELMIEGVRQMAAHYKKEASSHMDSFDEVEAIDCSYLAKQCDAFIEHITAQGNNS